MNNIKEIFEKNHISNYYNKGLENDTFAVFSLKNDDSESCYLVNKKAGSVKLTNCIDEDVGNVFESDYKNIEI